MDSDLTCPACGGRMVGGWLRVKGTMPGFLFFGLSWQHLWWTDRGDDRASRRRLIASGGHRPAHRCESCDMVAFRPSPQSY